MHFEKANSSSRRRRGRIIARRRAPRRRGSAVVDFAMTAPIFFLILFGGMEFSRVNLLRNMCASAALEGAREGMLPGATASDCQDAAEEMLDILAVKEYTVTVTPNVILPETPEITVTVEVPMSDNALPMSEYVLGGTVTRSITLPRELP